MNPPSSAEPSEPAKSARPTSATASTGTIRGGDDTSATPLHDTIEELRATELDTLRRLRRALTEYGHQLHSAGQWHPGGDERVLAALDDDCGSLMEVLHLLAGTTGLVDPPDEWKAEYIKQVSYVVPSLSDILACDTVAPSTMARAAGLALTTPFQQPPYMSSLWSIPGVDLRETAKYFGGESVAQDAISSWEKLEPGLASTLAAEAASRRFVDLSIGYGRQQMSSEAAGHAKLDTLKNRLENIRDEQKSQMTKRQPDMDDEGDTDSNMEIDIGLQVHLEVENRSGTW